MSGYHAIASVSLLLLFGWLPYHRQSPARPAPPKDGPASAELRAIAKADQDDRSFTRPPTAEEWKPAHARDETRRKRVLALLQANRLVTADDFDNAALVFQHGDTADDFLAAHELASIARMLGHVGSMPALAEDRFLKTIGKTQRIGSQFSYSNGGDPVLDPVDEGKPDSVTDALRRDLFVPTPAEWLRDGLNATKTSFKTLVARLEQRTDPAWLKTEADRPVSRELARWAAKPDADAVRRVLALYRADELAAPQDYLHAAQVLTRAGDPASLLPHELALVAAARGSIPARRLFAQTLDRYLAAIGLSPRYGTIPATGPKTPDTTSTLTAAVRVRLGLPKVARTR